MRVRLLRPSVVVIVLLTVFAGFGSTAQAQTGGITSLGLPELHIQVLEDRFNIPAYVEEGRTLIALENLGSEPRASILVRLPDEVTVGELLSGSGEDAPPSWLFQSSFPGFPHQALPGDTEYAVVDLRAGLYLVIDDFSAIFVVTPKVDAGASPIAVADPPADATLRLFEFNFAFDEPIASGQHLTQVVNAGRVPHEVLVFQAPDGTTLENVMGLLASDSDSGSSTGGLTEDDLTDVGGLGWLSPGASGWIDLDLAPGTYVLACFVFDPEAGVPHAMEGMVQIIEVA